MRRARAEGRLCLRLAVLLRALRLAVDRDAEANFLPVLCVAWCEFWRDAVLCDVVFLDAGLCDAVLCDAADEPLCVVVEDDELA